MNPYERIALESSQVRMSAALDSYLRGAETPASAIGSYVTEIQDNYAARYNALCTAFHECQRLYCEEITRQQAANLRKKRQLRGLRSGIRSQRNIIAALTK